MEAFGDWDFDEHPFVGLGGYAQARRVFGGGDSLKRLISGLNAAVFSRGQTDVAQRETAGAWEA